MRWTKERPIIDGWYWYRNHKSISRLDVAVLKYGEKIMAPLRDSLIDIALFDGEWSGPIHEPED